MMQINYIFMTKNEIYRISTLWRAFDANRWPKWGAFKVHGCLTLKRWENTDKSELQKDRESIIEAKESDDAKEQRLQNINIKFLSNFEKNSTK